MKPTPGWWCSGLPALAARSERPSRRRRASGSWSAILGCSRGACFRSAMCVRRALSYLAPAATAEQRQKALGLAMGRVVAHELYHVLAHTTEHTQRGLTQA